MTRKTELAGKIAVVTGAGSGIGAATARLLAARGATVHLADLNADTAETVARQIRQAGGSAEAHGVDVCDPAAVEALAKAVYDADGRVDILHNNAGIGHGGNIEATTIEDWQQVIGVNLLGVAYGIQAFVPRMLTQGRPASIVNTASLAGLMPVALMAPYCASKYGVVGMTEALNAEHIKEKAPWTPARKIRLEPHSTQARRKRPGCRPGTTSRTLGRTVSRTGGGLQGGEQT
jgi:NAD(P)-dependent dehydrogenase (short-subunit alcohol dehydrogenase family)